MTSRAPLVYSPRIQVSARPSGVAASLDGLAYSILCAFIFCVPWEDAVAMDGLVIGRLLGPVAFALVLLRMGATREGRPLATPHYWMLAWVGWAALSILWTSDLEMTQSRIGTYVQLLAAVWLIWELAVSRRRMEGLFQSYVFGAGVAALWTIYNYMIGRTAAQIATSEGKTVWETTRYTIPGFNENDLGLMLALSIPMTVYLLASRRGRMMSVLYWLQLGACVTAILLTGSRGGLISAVIALTMIPLTLSHLPQWSTRSKIAAVVACAVIIGCVASFAPESSWRRFSQTGSEMTEGTLTHRTVIWAAGLAAFRDHAFLGVGSGSYASTVLRAVDVYYVAHNTFLSILVELGVLGELLFVVLLAVLFDRVRGMPKLEKRLWTVLFSTWAVGVSVLTWEYRKPTWLLFGLFVAHLSARRAEKLYVISRGAQAAVEPTRERA